MSIKNKIGKLSYIRVLGRWTEGLFGKVTVYRIRVMGTGGKLPYSSSSMKNEEVLFRRQEKQMGLEKESSELPARTYKDISKNY